MSSVHISLAAFHRREFIGPIGPCNWCGWYRRPGSRLCFYCYAELHTPALFSGITPKVQVRQSISISAELAQALRMRAERDQISMSAVVCQLLSRELGQELHDVRKRFEEIVKQGELFEGEKSK
jgi:hypothetical protein